jgi:hypothetical protein
MKDAIGQDIQPGDVITHMPYRGKGSLQKGYVHHLNAKTVGVARRPDGDTYYTSMRPDRMVVVTDRVS